MHEIVVVSDAGLPVFHTSIQGALNAPPLFATQAMLEQAVNQGLKKMKCGRLLYVFEKFDNLYFMVVSSRGHSEHYLRWQLQLVYSLLKLRMDSNFVCSNQALTNSVRKHVLTMVELCDSRQAFMVQGIEFVSINEDAWDWWLRPCVELRSTCRGSIRNAIAEHEEILAGVLLVGTKVVAQYSKPQQSGILTSDLILLLMLAESLFGTAESTSNAQSDHQGINDSLSEQNFGVPADAMPLVRSSLDQIFSTRRRRGSVARSHSEMDGDELLSGLCIQTALESDGEEEEFLSASGQSSGSKPGAVSDKESEEGRYSSHDTSIAGNTIADVRSPIMYSSSSSSVSEAEDLNDDGAHAYNEKGKTATEPANAMNDFFDVFYILRRNGTNHGRRSHADVQSFSRQRMTVYLSQEGNSKVRCIFLCAAQDPSPSSLSVLRSCRQSVMRDLSSQLDFITVKEMTHISMLSYIHQFPGLLHFIFIDRSSHMVIAPSISSTLAGFEGADSRHVIRELCRVGQQFLAKGYTFGSIRAGDLIYSYKLWFEPSAKAGNSHGRSPAAELVPEKLPLQTDGLKHVDGYGELIGKSFPSVKSSDAVVCKEMYALFLSTVPTDVCNAHMTALATMLRDICK